MAMAVDQRQHQIGGMAGYNQMRYPPAPQFTNPWATTGATTSAPVYPTSLAPSQPVLDTRSPQAQAPATTAYNNTPISAASAVAFSAEGALEQSNLVASQDAINAQRPFASFSQPEAQAPAQSYPQNYAYSPDQTRRPSHAIQGQTSQAQRDSFSDALDASRGMVAMSQDITPRNIYGTANPRSASDAYGFPSNHSSHSSISSASTYPSYYNGSVGDSSVTDYSSASEMGDMTSRTLPRPSGLAGVSLPPAPQSMMGQFSSKVSSSSQKKHKCKICDKRFTRPSSLQTHMYSHTGEKPFACDVDGCGRHFSVVSNLRRHKKVHKGEREQPSPDED